MTYEEAIDYAKGVNFCAGCDKPQFADNSAEICEMCEHRQFFEKVIDALEKQIPKKPLVKDYDLGNKDDNDVECPICGALFGSVGDLLQGEIMKTAYCYNCGQAIDWETSDREERINGLRKSN